MPCEKFFVMYLPNLHVLITVGFLLSFHGVRLVDPYVVLTRPTVAQAMRLVKTLPCLMQRAERYIELEQRSGSSEKFS